MHTEIFTGLNKAFVPSSSHMQMGACRSNANFVCPHIAIQPSLSLLYKLLKIWTSGNLYSRQQPIILQTGLACCFHSEKTHALYFTNHICKFYYLILVSFVFRLQELFAHFLGEYRYRVIYLQEQQSVSIFLKVSQC